MAGSSSAAGGASAAGAASGAAGASGGSIGGLIMSVGGMVAEAITAYSKAKLVKLNAEKAASAQDFKSDQKALEASIARDDIGLIKRAGNQAKANVTMRAGIEMSKQLTRQGARGITIGKGSAAEAMMSDELIKDIDAYTIDSNTLRQVQARRMQIVNIRAQSLLAGVSAQNIRGSVEDISPGWAAATSLLGGAGPVSEDAFRLFGGSNPSAQPRTDLQARGATI